MFTDVNGDPESLSTDFGGRARFIEHDVTDESAWDRVVSTALSEFGKIDILINNAGVYRPQPLDATDRDNFELHFRVNQLGAFLGMRAVLPSMIASGGGSIVNISSGAGLAGTPGMFAYASSKWALRGMSRCAARDLARYNIRVNVVLPGLIDTPMAASNSPEVLGALMAMIPAQRLGSTAEVAELVAFLSSDAASYITGGEFKIDGGLNA